MTNPLVLDNPSSSNGVKEEKKVDIAEVQNKVNSKIPSDYIPITLESNGRLDAPKVLHFRDFSMDDALELNVLDRDDQLKALVAVLNNMVYEEFDCKNLHVKELMQILYTIHGTFISSKISKEYYINEDLPEGKEEGQLSHPDNIDKVEIVLSKLKTQNIDEDSKGKRREVKFKEPFTFVDTVKKTRMKFRLSRVGDLLFAQEYCNTLYEDELKRFKPLKRALEKLRDIEDAEEKSLRIDEMISQNEDEYEDYMSFIQKYDMTYIKLIQALQIVGIDDVVFNTIDEKLEAYKNNISETLWTTYSEMTAEYNFGIIEKYSFFCDKLSKNITRRFSFQLLDFLPDIEQDYSKRYNLRFD